jgi:hypothetical protein
MTVRRSDVRVGDRGGDPGLPAAEVSPPPSVSTERAPLGRFWALAVEDSNSSSKAEEGEGCSARALDYLCRSPSPYDTRDLVESLSGLARRAEKQRDRQNRQCSAAREFSSSTGKVRSSMSLSPSPASGSSPVCPFRLPVLEPTTFPLAADDVVGWVVVR